MLKKFILFLLLFNILNINCEFNPIIDDTGNPLIWNGNRPGTIGWLDIPIYKSRIMVLKTHNNLTPIYPLNPDLDIPKGLYCWLTNWASFIDKEEYFYEGLYQDAFYLNKLFKKETKNKLFLSPDPEKINGYFFHKKYKNWGKLCKSVGAFALWDPKNHEDVIKEFIDQKNTKEDNFYTVMGVTEKYFREFLGCDLKELNKPVKQRNTFNMPCPSIKHVNLFFPLNKRKIDNKVFIHRIGDLKVISGKGTGKLKFANGDKALKTDDSVFHIITTYNGIENYINKPTKLISESKIKFTANLESIIYRKYYLQPINLLENLKNKVIVQDGKIKKIIQPLDVSDIENINVMWQENSQYAITGLFSKEKLDNQTRKTLLTSIYIGAIKLAQYYNKKKLFLLVPVNLKAQVAEIFKTELLQKLIKESDLDITALVIK